ncbi:GNAT family N-acetyltransferase [Streptomyces sp. NBC_00690]|uniref:GNAT family N-acetyltransferase n=1 Tax=Streptomyces sp. NBC_00690 TaxID=2975808 RepID=UPI002E2CFCA3|nr:GNAT family N-acetyltransferase [Streptomyces sp. NBC_00690]
MTIESRAVMESEFPDWLRAVATGFLQPPTPSAEEIAARRTGVDLARTLGAFDDGRCVATYRTFAQRLTVVGGATVPSNAITNVTVSPTHRRRGLLSRLMTADLAVAKERGDAVASLISAEYPIYGRYGFGPATWMTEWEIDLPRTGLDRRWAGPTDGGRIDLVDPADVRVLGPQLHERLAADRPGTVSRTERWWQVSTGALKVPSQPLKEQFYAVHRTAEGQVDGLLAYQCDDHWGRAKQPQNTAQVSEMIALNPAAERALWNYVCSIDWVTTLRSGHRAPDDLLPRLLPDPRAAKVHTHADFLWLRVLDVVRALEARTYDVSATLVLEIHDGLGLASGRYRLEVSEQGAHCTRTTDSADLTLDVRELGALYLGDESALRLVELGTLEEHREGAARVAERVFRTPKRPWCPDVF